MAALAFTLGHGSRGRNFAGWPGVSARHRPEHRPGHPLCEHEQFRRAPARRLQRAECILRRDVAAALAQVQRDLAASNLALKVYDCYRPTRAVGTMAQWANDGRPGGSHQAVLPADAEEHAVRPRLHRVALGPFDRHRRRPDARRRAAVQRCRRSIRRRPTEPAPRRWSSAAPTTVSTWGRDTTASTHQRHQQAPASPMSSTAGANDWSRPWDGAASRITTANGGTSPTGRPTPTLTPRSAEAGAHGGKARPSPAQSLQTRRELPIARYSAVPRAPRPPH